MAQSCVQIDAFREILRTQYSLLATDAIATSQYGAGCSVDEANVRGAVDYDNAGFGAVEHRFERLRTRRERSVFLP
jgi:hypothetical protein